ncbi:hypothetical protein VitviT2T_019847 [Vitis vinifera]|uniref:DYW domain-containing protein n=2 Tax=Vitis vinifera TaxID=29760 RepID=A0ABY9D3R1_VITVI|eukprot:XP_010658909.1 PREDICTED: pentatricopeptide repeat-containing protein At5g04780 [Vitis vinifera]
MRMLKKQKILCNSFSLQVRHLLAISNAMAERPSSKELVWVGIRATHVSELQHLLQSSARNRAAIEGMACHAQIIRVGLRADTITSNMLMNMYSKCGLVESARKLFDEMPVRSLVSWNTMVGSHTQNGDCEKALVLFMQMQKEGTSCSEFTVSSVVCACAAKCCVFECKQLHGFALKTALDSNVFVGTALLDVYAKCGLVKDANLVFECMPERSDVTWSSMVAGYVQNELYEEALVLFHRAQAMGLEHNQFTISSALSACAARAALIEGKQVQAVSCKTGIGSNIFVISSLIDMYAKCGIIEEAYTVFSSVEEKNVVLWNAILSGFSRHVRSLEAMIYFEKMQQMGICPNDITYISVLSACSHLGLVEKGRKYFDLMIRVHNVSPNVLHYSCMVDILGRAGLLHEAKDFIDRMPFDATASMWGSLLASCRIYRNLELAEVAAKHLFEIEPHNAGNHVLLSNIYAANDRWEEVARARNLLKESKAKKERGKSWIEIKHKVHSFMVGERNHPRIVEIYLKLEDLVGEMKKIGYKAKTEHDLHDVEESRKQELLRHHSEKLALTFGIMVLPHGAPIRIMKNLRICGDCHSFMKLASSITEREIIVRDTNRFHHFKNGYCSCGEFW